MSYLCDSNYTNWSPVTRETGGYWIMEFNVAKAPKENLTVEVEGETIYIKGKCGSSSNKSYYYCYDMPRNIDIDKLTAEYQNGLITISVLLTPELKRNQVTLK